MKTILNKVVSQILSESEEFDYFEDEMKSSETTGEKSGFKSFEKRYYKNENGNITSATAKFDRYTGKYVVVLEINYEPKSREEFNSQEFALSRLDYFKEYYNLTGE